MKTYKIKGLTVQAKNAKMAFCAVCCWFGNNVALTVEDMETQEKHTFRRTIDASGNIVKIEEC